MNHQEAEGFLSTYLDRQLGIEKRQEIEQHLAGCHICAGRVDEWKRLSVQLKFWPVPQRDSSAEVTFSAAVLERLPHRSVGRRDPVRPPPWRSFLFPIGAVLSAAFIQAGAIVSLLLGILIMLGLVPPINFGLGSVLPETQPAFGNPSGITWFTWVGDQIIGLASPSDAAWLLVLELVLSWIVPSLFFLSVLFMIMMLLSSWAGWQIRGRRN